jgi:hypothetical protein
MNIFWQAIHIYGKINKKIMQQKSEINNSEILYFILYPMHIPLGG